MKFCTKCGNEVIEGALFCTSCGNDLRENITTKTNSEHDVDLDTTNPEIHYDMDLVNTKPESNDHIDPVTSGPYEDPTDGLKLSKRNKSLMALFVIIIVLIVTTIKIGNSLTDPSKLVTRFENDVATNNVSDLSKILYSNDSRLKIDSKTI